MIIYNKQGQEVQYGRCSHILKKTAYIDDNIFTFNASPSVTTFDNVRVGASGSVICSTPVFYVEKIDLLRLSVLNMVSPKATIKLGFYNADGTAYIEYRSSSESDCVLAIKKDSSSTEVTYNVPKIKLSTSKPKNLSISVMPIDKYTCIMYNGYVAFQVSQIEFDFTTKLMCKASITSEGDTYILFSELNVNIQKSI